MPLMPPSDSEDDTHNPHPNMHARRDSTSPSSTTSEETEETSESELETNEDNENPMSRNRVTAIFRPTCRIRRPPFVHAVHHPLSQAWKTEVYNTWPPLRYAPWTAYQVHRTFAREFPQGDNVIHLVIATVADLPSHLHQVAFIVGVFHDMTLFQAWPLPPFVDRNTILREMNLQTVCAHRTTHCKVYINSLALGQSDQRAIQHGDYVMIRLHQALQVPGRQALARAFGVDDDFGGHAYITEAGIARIGGEAAAAANAMVTNFHAPQTIGRQVLHEEYWLGLGAFCWIYTLWLIWLQQTDKKLRSPSERRVRKRRLCPIRQHPHRRPPYLLLWLVISQPAVTTGLQLHGLGQTPDTNIEIHDTGALQLDPVQYWRSIGHHVALTPPGNTMSEAAERLDLLDNGEVEALLPHDHGSENFLHTCLTDHGLWLCRQICLFSEANLLRSRLERLCWQ